MKKLFAIAMMIAGLAFPALGQDAAKKETHPQAVLEAWNEVS